MTKARRDLNLPREGSNFSSRDFKLFEYLFVSSAVAQERHRTYFGIIIVVGRSVKGKGRVPVLLEHYEGDRALSLKLEEGELCLAARPRLMGH